MLHWIDWLIIISFLALSLGIGLYYRKGAGKSISDFFLGGRNLPWYVAGMSMVATTFAADTPLAVAELVAQHGIAGNWLWWSFIFGGALTTFFFASLWRRSGVLTELEFITLRYEGKPAFYLRLVKSVYLGLILNAVIIAWVNLAMATILEVFFDLDHTTALLCTFGMMLLAVIYAALSGLKGVAITDMVQFGVAMAGCIILAVIAVNSEAVGGVEAMKAKLPQGAIDFMPRINSLNDNSAWHGLGLTIGAFLSFVAVQWWSSWYPGAEPGGGGYVAQRMMSTRSAQESVWATLLFQIGHYCVRPWPWIMVGLCAIVLYAPEVNDKALNDRLTAFSKPHTELATEAEVFNGELAGRGAQNTAEYLRIFPSDAAKSQSISYFYEPRLGFVMVMRDFLPVGLVGLLIVAFIAAYLSTISTQVNWGASYLINDLIIPVTGNSDQGALVKMSRWASIAVMIAGALVTPFITSISGVWSFIMQCGAGLGLVLILRWYWWRINAWSEITATIAPIIAYAFCHFYLNDKLGETFQQNNGSFYFTVAFTTVSWLIATFMTAPPTADSITFFNKRVEPMGIWPMVAVGVTQRNKQLKWMLGGWISMASTILFTLFTLGNLVLLEYDDLFINMPLALLSAFLLRLFLKKTNIFDRNSETA